MSFARAVLGVLVGFSLFAGVIGLASPARKGYSGLGSIATDAALIAGAGAAAGFLTASIAGRHKIPLSSVIGILILGLALISMQRNGESRPGWHEIALAGCGPVAAVFGAGLSMLAGRQKQSQ